MPVFIIEEYQVYTQKYRVAADNRAEAVKLRFAGGGDPVIDGLERASVDKDQILGMTLDDGRIEVDNLDDDLADFADEIEAAGIELDDGILMGIRDVEELKDNSPT